MDTSVITWTVEGGAPGRDERENPLSCAFRRLLEDGFPFDSFAICLYPGEESEFADDSVPMRWLGVFVRTTRRVLFFPGLSMAIEKIQLVHGPSEPPWRSFRVDHASLEIDRRRWHFTSPGSKKHIATGRTPDMGEGRMLWCSLSVANEAVLRELKQKTVVTFLSPPTDSDRRLDLFRDLVQGAPYQAIALPDGARSRFIEGFLHLRFIVGPTCASLYTGDRAAFPLGSPYFKGSIPESADVPCRHHRIRLSDDISLQISSYWLPGSLSVPAFFTSAVRL